MIKSIPFISIFRAAALSICAWAFASAFLQWGFQNIPAVDKILGLFLSNPMNLLTSIGVGFIVGAFALLLSEKFEQLLTTTQLWILVCFSSVGMCLYDFFPIRSYRLLGLNFSPFMLTGIVLGIFLCGRKHWR